MAYALILSPHDLLVTVWHMLVKDLKEHFLAKLISTEERILAIVMLSSTSIFLRVNMMLPRDIPGVKKVGTLQRRLPSPIGPGT